MSDLREAIFVQQMNLAIAQAQMEHRLAHAGGLKPEQCIVCMNRPQGWPIAAQPTTQGESK